MKNETKKWAHVILMSSVLIGLYAIAKAATPKTPDATAPREAPQRLNPTGTGVQPAVPDTGNSQTAPGSAGSVPTEIKPTQNGINKTNGAPPQSRAGQNVTTDVNGVIESVDQNNGASRVTVRDAQGNVNSFVIDKNTAIMKDNVQTPVSGVATGDSVILRRTGTTGTPR